MSASCRQVARTLPSLAAGECSDHALRAHVDGCAVCRERIERARWIAAALRALPRVQMPASANSSDAAARSVLLDAVSPLDQEQMGRALAAALPRLRLPETSALAPSVESDGLADSLSRGAGAGAGIEPVLRVALRAPTRTPGWLWSRVRADLRSLLAKHAEPLALARAAQSDRSLQRWSNSGLAAAAALVLALWFSSTLQAKVQEDPEPVIIHEKPLLSGQSPEAIHEELREWTMPEPVVPPVGTGGRK